MCVYALRYLKGMYSFGLMETRFYDEAEKVAMEVSFSSLLYSLLLHIVVIILSVWSRLSVPELIVSLQFCK